MHIYIKKLEGIFATVHFYQPKRLWEKNSEGYPEEYALNLLNHVNTIEKSARDPRLTLLSRTFQSIRRLQFTVYSIYLCIRDERACRYSNRISSRYRAANKLFIMTDGPTVKRSTVS